MHDPDPLVELDEDHKTVTWTHTCAMPRKDDEPYITRVSVRLPLGQHGWSLVQAEPLTIHPSILCGGCQLHGFWQNGQWNGV